MNGGADETNEPRASDAAWTALNEADSAESVITAVVGIFGPSARVYAIDHEFHVAVPLAVDDDPIELIGTLRSALLRSESHSDGSTNWIPLAQRNQPTFLVAHDGPDVSSAEDRSFLGAMLEGHRRRFEDLESIRRRHEMSVAAELQWDLLPMTAEKLGEYEIGGVLEPAYEVAGDVFDFADANGSLWAYSFDGMGHGLEATMTGALVLAAVRNVRRAGGTLVEQMTRANSLLFDQYGGDRFVTGAACRLDPDGSVHVVNAGHEPIRTVLGGSVSQLDLLVDVPLGVQSDATFREQHAVTLAPDDGLVMLSDGPAGQMVDGEAFGPERLDEALKTAWSTSPLHTGHDIVDEVLDFVDGGSVDDDITIVVVRRRSHEANRGEAS